MASVEWRGYIYDLMLVRHPTGTHLSQSRSIPGGNSTLSRDDEDNDLRTHAVLFPSDKALAVGVAVVLSAGIALGAAAPHVKSRFNNIKSKLNRKPENSAEAAQGSRPEQSDMEDEEPPSGDRHLSAA